jgi:hypothetical protein
MAGPSLSPLAPTHPRVSLSPSSSAPHSLARPVPLAIYPSAYLSIFLSRFLAVAAFPESIVPFATFCRLDFPPFLHYHPGGLHLHNVSGPILAFQPACTLIRSFRFKSIKQVPLANSLIRASSFLTATFYIFSFVKEDLAGFGQVFYPLDIRESS